MFNLYHGSATTGLIELEPRECALGRKAVYATADWVLAFIFAGKLPEYNKNGERQRRGFEVYLEDNCVVIEDFNGYTVDEMLANHGEASIYHVAAEDFDGTTDWDAEVYSEFPVAVVFEEVVEDYGDMLHDLIVEGRIRIAA